MEKLVIQGGQPLCGTLAISASKNTALPLMATAILPHGVTHLDHIPRLRDITTFSHVLRITGASVERKGRGLEIDATRIGFPEAPYELVKKMRASFYMLGALIGRCQQARGFIAWWMCLGPPPC